MVKQESCTHTAADTGKLQATQRPQTPARLYHQQPQLSGLGQTATPPSQGTPTHKRKLEEMQQADNLGAGGKSARHAAASALESGLPQLKADSESSAVRASTISSGSLQLKAKSGASVTLPSTLASSTAAVKGTPLTSQDIAQTFAVVVATLAILYGYDTNDLMTTCIAMCSSGSSKSALTNVMVPLVLSAVSILFA